MQALSDAIPLERAATRDSAAVVLQLGPALTVRGGVSSVEQLIVDHVGASIDLRHIATTDDGSIWRKARQFIASIRQLHAALRSHQRTIVHIHFASRGSTLRKMVLAWMTLRAHRPLILHAHGAAFDQFFEGLPSPLRRVVCKTFARADCFVVLSTQWRDFYMRRCGISARRIEVLYNPTALPKVIVDRRNRSRVQCLFLGRIGERKGAWHLLRAFAALPKSIRQRARLVFAGDGEVAALRAQARELGEQVEVHSWVDARQRSELLEASDVFVLPSFQEGVPMALLEAMAAGLPVVTTPVGGIPDVVNDGREGLLVPPGDVDRLQAALHSLIDDEERRLEYGRHARARAEQFDVEHFSTQLQAIYRRVLS